MFRGECPKFRNIYTVYTVGKHCRQFIFMNMSEIITKAGAGRWNDSDYFEKMLHPSYV